MMLKSGVDFWINKSCEILLLVINEVSVVPVDDPRALASLLRE